MALKNYSGKGFTQDFLRLMADWKKTRDCCANFLVGIVTEDSDTVTFEGDGTKLHPLIAHAVGGASADNGLSVVGGVIKLGDNFGATGPADLINDREIFQDGRIIFLSVGAPVLSGGRYVAIGDNVFTDTSGITIHEDMTLWPFPANNRKGFVIQTGDGKGNLGITRRRDNTGFALDIDVFNSAGGPQFVLWDTGVFSLVQNQSAANSGDFFQVSHTVGGAATTGSIHVTPAWNTSGSPTALFLNVTNTASGANSLLVDWQVGGTSLVRATKAGVVGIGVGNALPLGTQLHLNNGGTFSATLPVLGPLTITGTTTAFASIIAASNTANAEGGIIVMRARGTLAAPLALNNGDFVAAYIGAIFDGASRQTSGALEFYVDGVPAGPVCPIRASISTGTFGGDRLPHLTVDHLAHVGIGTNVTTGITAWLHLMTPSDGTAGRAPLKFTAGTNLVTPENGAMEFDGTHLYITIGGVRTTIV